MCSELTPTKPYGLRAGVPQRKIQVKFLEKERNARQIKTHVYLWKHHFECRDRTSKSVLTNCLRPGRAQTVLWGKKKFYSVRKSEEGVMKNGEVNKGLTVWSLMNHV